MFKAASSRDICNKKAPDPTHDNQPVDDLAEIPIVDQIPVGKPLNVDSTGVDVILAKEQKLEAIKNQCSLLISELDTGKDPEAVIRKHISQLKKYNELKDIALGLVTMIADQRHLRTSDILEEMKVELNDD